MRLGIGGGPRAEGEGLKAEGRRHTGANAERGGRGLRASYEHSSGSSSHAAESLSTLFGPEAQPGNNVNGHIKNEMKTTRLLVR